MAFPSTYKDIQQAVIERRRTLSRPPKARLGESGLLPGGRRDGGDLGRGDDGDDLRERQLRAARRGRADPADVDYAGRVELLQPAARADDLGRDPAAPPGRPRQRGAVREPLHARRDQRPRGLADPVGGRHDHDLLRRLRPCSRPRTCGVQSRRRRSSVGALAGRGLQGRPRNGQWAGATRLDGRYGSICGSCGSRASSTSGARPTVATSRPPLWASAYAICTAATRVPSCWTLPAGSSRHHEGRDPPTASTAASTSARPPWRSARAAPRSVQRVGRG